MKIVNDIEEWAPKPPVTMRSGWAKAGDIVLWVLVVAFWAAVGAILITWFILYGLALVTALFLQLCLIPFRW